MKNLFEIPQGCDWYRGHPSCTSHEGRLGGDEQTTFSWPAVYDGVSGGTPGYQNIQGISRCYKAFECKLSWRWNELSRSSKSNGNRSKGINGNTPSHLITKKWHANNLHCTRCHGKYVSVDKESCGTKLMAHGWNHRQKFIGTSGCHWWNVFWRLWGTEGRTIHWRVSIFGK